MKKFLTNSSHQTFNLGKDLAAKLESGGIVLLYGELGTGKTTFIKGMAEGLGTAERILSPTFILHRIHKVNIRNIRQLNHLDLYRLEKQTEIKSLGLDEIIEDEGSITVIEWADRIKDFKINKGLPAGRQCYKIWFGYLGKDKREIRIKKLT